MDDFWVFALDAGAEYALLWVVEATRDHDLFKNATVSLIHKEGKRQREREREREREKRKVSQLICLNSQIVCHKEGPIVCFRGH
jgi:hypothetical protein